MQSTNKLSKSQIIGIIIKSILIFFIVIGTVDFFLVILSRGRINPVDSIKTFINNRFGWETIIGDPSHFDLGTVILILSSICSILYDIIALFWILKPFEFDF